MPELPEVQHIADWLRPQLSGHVIAGVSVAEGNERPVPQGLSAVNAAVKGRTVSDVTRRAKVLFLELGGGDSLAIHLKMTGQLWPGASAQQPPAHTRATVEFEDGPRVFFVDIRRFGWIRYWTPADRAAWEQDIGPEPVPALPPEWGASLRGKRTVKAAILDQAVVAGVGNIFADESLFRAGILPQRTVDSLSPSERAALQRAVEDEMNAGVAERSGVPDQKRVGSGDRSVKALFNWRVFQRDGEPCTVCGTPIIRTTVAQRGTYYCPVCQK